MTEIVQELNNRPRKTTCWTHLIALSAAVCILPTGCGDYLGPINLKGNSRQEPQKITPVPQLSSAPKVEGQTGSRPSGRPAGSSASGDLHGIAVPSREAVGRKYKVTVSAAALRCYRKDSNGRWTFLAKMNAQSKDVVGDKRMHNPKAVILTRQENGFVLCYEFKDSPAFTEVKISGSRLEKFSLCENNSQSIQHLAKRMEKWVEWNHTGDWSKTCYQTAKHILK